MTERTRKARGAADPLATPVSTKPQPSEAVVTMGQPTKRRSSLFIDDPLFQELRGANAERTLDRMTADPVIAGIIERTRLTLRSADWTIQPGGDGDADRKFADRLQSDVDELDSGWKSTVAEAAEMIVWGFSLFEALFRRDGDGFHWADFSPRDQRTVLSWDTDPGTGALRAVQQQVWGTGPRPEPIPAWKLLHFRTRPASGRPEGASLVRNAFLPWTDKQELRRIMKLGLRRDFTGVAKYQVPAKILTKGATPDEKAALSAAEALVREFERDEREGLIVPAESKEDGQPSGWKLELMQGTSRRQVALEELWQIHNREIGIALLAEFVLLGHEDTGTYNLGSAKMSFFGRAVGSWLDVMGEHMTHKAVRYYQALNPQLAGAKPPKFVHGDVDPIPLSDLAQFVQAVVGSGAVLTDPELDKYLRSRMGAPEATASREL